MVQWLGLHASKAGGYGFNPWSANWHPTVKCSGQNIKKLSTMSHLEMKSLNTVCERRNAQITCLALYSHGYYIQVHTPRVAVYLVFRWKCGKIHKKGEGRATGVSHPGKDDGATRVGVFRSYHGHSQKCDPSLHWASSKAQTSIVKRNISTQLFG